ncbi:hypothetical protein NQD34_006600 [Periophthalmus magnuspinnatus]|nr:hypothetical protein NQD34_006600 [Periophthalmus magnuspinnatus]
MGGPEPDVDSVAATLSLALHLSLKRPSDELVVPVLCPPRGHAPLPHDTLCFLDTLGLSDPLLLWNHHLDLSSLQDEGRLSLTLLRDGLLQSSDLYALQPSVRRVVHRRGQRDEEGAGSSAVTTVAREILQEAPEHVGSALGPTLREALRLQREALWIQHGRRSEQVDELLRVLEQMSHSKLPDWEQLLTKDPKEFSDGEMTIVLTSVTMETQVKTRRQR